ncbi:carboxymuconolactone decarboxylase family protein [Ideonella paludis]|uniref:Carboxymuconolactone decarboxylase family protein n=1 Tax=Ideonella paludis TaxID=1233411 RepID=A0ABS5DWF8_9BURK|nr:carboxymuconolactone decarboxylase family protein [Ideonella paludis]MBQ0935485.1 carboxymuconolactone decarboxylase family protein [Ideonella paludis]
MSHLPLLTADQARGPAAPLLAEIQTAFGATPNMFKAAANSPAALQALWGSFKALGQGTLPAKLTEQLAVAVANRNSCHYCLAAHTALGRKAGATAQEMSAAQLGQSEDLKTATALGFAVAVVEGRGQVNPPQLDALRAVGFTNEEMMELLAHVALNLFTNYVNVVFDVELDFPKVELRLAQ